MHKHKESLTANCRAFLVPLIKTLDKLHYYMYIVTKHITGEA